MVSKFGEICGGCCQQVAAISAAHEASRTMLNTKPLKASRCIWMCRARGFKDHGDYETVKGFEIQKLGHTITAILRSIIGPMDR